MNATQAIRRLTKLLGPKFGYRLDAKALGAEGREAAALAWRAVREKLTAAQAARDARRAELLSDPAYQAMRAECIELDKQCSTLLWQSTHKRVTVGVCSGMFFHHKADGDNWAEVVEAVTTKATA